MREQEISERLEMDKRRKDNEHKIKKLSNTSRLTKAKDELNKMETEKKETVYILLFFNSYFHSYSSNFYYLLLF